MSKSAITILFLMSLVLVASGKNDKDEDWSPDGVNVDHVRYFFSAGRGFLEGFKQGLYNDDKLVLSA
jgi:hypothetical protein